MCVYAQEHMSWPMWRSDSNVWRLVLFFQLTFNEVSLAISAPLLFLCLPAPSWITYAQHNIQLLMWAAKKQAYGIRLVLQVLSPAVPSRWPHLSTLLVTKHVFPVEFPSPLFAIRVYSWNGTHRPRYLASSCRPSQYNKQMAPFLPHPLPAHNPGAEHRGIE